MLQPLFGACSRALRVKHLSRSILKVENGKKLPLLRGNTPSQKAIVVKGQQILIGGYVTYRKQSVFTMMHYSILSALFVLQLSSRFAPSLSFSFPRLLGRTNKRTAAIFRPFTWSKSQLWINASSIDNMDDFKFQNDGDLRKEAASLRARAKEIMAEAKAMEVELLISRNKKKEAKISESDNLIDSLFPSETLSFTPADVAEALRNERWSPELVYMVVDRIFERQKIAMGQTVSSDIDFPIGGRANLIKVNSTEYGRLGAALETLSDAAAMLDNEVANMPTSAMARRWNGRIERDILARYNELKRTHEQIADKKFASEINRVADSNQSVEEHVLRSLNVLDADEGIEGIRLNASQIFSAISLAPMWVPSSFLPFIISSEKSTLGPEQVEIIKDKVLQGSRFFVTSSDSIPGAAIFRGNIRTQTGAVATENSTNYTAVVFDEIQSHLEHEGLTDLVQLFFMPDPEWRYKRNEIQSGAKPVILALSKAVSPETVRLENDSSVRIRNVSHVYDQRMVTLLLKKTKLWLFSFRRWRIGVHYLQLLHTQSSCIH